MIQSRNTIRLFGAVATVVLIGMPMFSRAAHQPHAADPGRPNILWISWEDCGPQFGAYGDSYADTPHVDALAKEGMVYRKAYANYPVCAPARAAIITGMYPNSLGAMHMQCRTIPPDDVRLFPTLLRKAGYFCTNDAKDHYQMEYDRDVVWDKMGTGRWDKDGYHGFWKERPEETPFFSVVNFFRTHEGNSRTNKAGYVEEIAQTLGRRKHDPAKAPVPPYYPDTRVVRENIALYYDNLTIADSLVGVILKQLDDEGLSDNTIVFFWGDHGWGLPRGKRWTYESGLRVPLIIRVPEKYKSWASVRYQPGSASDELVSFVDLAPTVLSLAGVAIPDNMHGQAFLGPAAHLPKEAIFGGRDRMDETTDMMRFVLTRDFLYVRNYYPDLPYVQTIRTMERQPIMQELRRMYAEGTLDSVQMLFFQRHKPVEELYDLRKDPHQINNLAALPGLRAHLHRFRKMQKDWMVEVGEVGLLTESEFDLLKWPSVVWPRTETPIFETRRIFWNGDAELELKCQTPGAEIVWRKAGEKRWRLYQQPVVLGTDETLMAKASRLGFHISDVISMALNQNTTTRRGRSSQAQNAPVVEKELIERLLALKDLDFNNDVSAAAYYEFLNDAEPWIRYWAVRGIILESTSRKERARAREKLHSLLEDPSPTVRIAVAEAFCKWGSFERGAAVLKAALGHTHESVRLRALNAIESLGEEARRFLPFPYIAPGTANHYSHRVVLRIYKRLGVDIRSLQVVDNHHLNEIQRVYDTIVLTERL